jgi:hypothetical protein
MQTEKYDVLMDVSINNKVHRKGGTVYLTERQAKYHRLAKKIKLAPVKVEPPKQVENKTTKSSYKGGK